VSGMVSESRWGLGLLLASNGPAVARSKYDVGDLAFIAPGQERHTKFQDSTRYFVAMIDPQELQAVLASQPGAYDEELQRHRRSLSVVSAAPAIAGANVAQMQPLLDALIEHGPAMSDDTVEFYKRNILELLTAPIRDAVNYQGAQPLSADLLVRQVDRYIIDAGTRPIHISELCERFNVHRRKLHRAFDEILGIPPITFLRRKRLGDVHAALQTDRHDVTVRQIAIEHGFLELGRFAAAYRRMFGELPSTTLRRARSSVVSSWWPMAVWLATLN
jgi:AraC-like DNA-binding protein